MMSKQEIIQLAEKVNDYWLTKNPDVGNCAWERGAYMIGNIAAYEIAGKSGYLDYALRWADANGWRFYNDAAYKNVSADNQICGQSYLKLLKLVPGHGTDEHLLKSTEFTLNDTRNDYWWWIDAIYMALPFYIQMGMTYNDDRCFEKAHRLFTNIKTERACYDKTEHLWYRDERFLPDRERTREGKKLFWSRGNGWVFAGLARALHDMPKEHRYYEEYKTVFVDMAVALLKCQQENGGFTTSLYAPEDFPACETSGTALFTLGFLMGARMGLLDTGYYDAGIKGFEWLCREALEENGKLGWVQAVAWGPGEIRRETGNDYAVGTFLLILKELYGM